MDPLRIAIVEDEESNQKILQDYLERLSKEKGILFKIAVFNNGVAFSEQLPGRIRLGLYGHPDAFREWH